MSACRVCSHEKRKDIDRWVLVGRQIEETAEKFKISRSALYWHLRRHLPWKSRKAKPGVTPKEKLADLDFELRRLQALAECGERISGALRAVTARRNLLELEIRMNGGLDPIHKKLLLATKPPEGDFKVEFIDGRPRTVPVGAEP
jgi:hypothetical protein